MNNDPLFDDNAPPKPPTAQPVKPMQLPLPQFSLWSVIVATAFLMLAASHWWTSVQLEVARREVQESWRDLNAEQFRVRRGLLPEVVRRDKLTHVAYLAHASSYYWQWRVHVPAHTQYQLYLSLEYPFDHQRDETDWKVLLKPGEGIITFQVVRTQHGDFQIVRTIDWQDYNSNALPVRSVATMTVDSSTPGISEKKWDKLTPQSFSLSTDEFAEDLDTQYQAQDLKSMGNERYLKYDPRDLIILSSDVHIWLEPVKPY